MGLDYAPPDPERVLDNPDGTQASLVAFLAWCRENGVTAAGGLPTVFDDTRHSEALIDTLRAFYAQNGAPLIVLPNLSQYPRGLFFDTSMHLQEEAQRAHSALVVEALSALLR